MNVVIRTDASIEIGSGHVMRCITIAKKLKEQGSSISFITRNHKGNLINFIKGNGFDVFVLPLSNENKPLQESKKKKILFHRSWLGSSQLSDALECINILKVIKPELVIVDHYAIDYVWEKEINHFTKKIMVIDDLMDRRHECSLLLDQTLGRSIEDYSNLVSNECTMMLGSSYALIRSEFLAWRENSIHRRLNESSINIKHLLINMGGVDKDNITSMVLDSLSNTNLLSSLNITVVMGLTSPNINKVKESINKSRFLIDLKIGVKNFEEIISKSDLAIGAAGSSSWERCFLGLPSILIVLADNQNSVASSLSSKGAAKVINNIDDIEKSLPLILSDLINTPKEILKMSKSASSIIDGKGIDRIVKKIHAYK